MNRQRSGALTACARSARPVPAVLVRSGLRTRSHPAVTVHARKSHKGGSSDEESPRWQTVLATTALSALTAASLLLSSPLESLAEPVRVIRLPASANPEIFNAQRVLVEAWTIVGESFVDPQFNSLDWPEELRKHMIAAYTSDATQKAWDEINVMLSQLGDPYTRRIEPEEYQAFRVSADGELQGIGLLLANELTSSGHLRVLAPIKGGPADRAGILPGDEVVSINGEDTTGWTGERAARVLRGQGGTEVRVRLARHTEGIPGVPSRPEPRPEPDFIIKEVSLKREAVAISPVYGTLLTPPGEELTAAAAQPPVGYVRLSTFSGNAAQQMRQAVSSLKAQGASRFILDLRSNPGGLVKAGVDVVAMFLDGEQTVFTVASREPGTQVQTTESAKPALTHDPLVVLVDHMSASASEIVSGALHDNGRALVMGDTATYGKGRIQSVFELQDGSALFVTVAKYQTPLGTDIDMRGIRPDLACSPGSIATAMRQAALAATPAGGNALPSRNAFGAPILRRAAAAAVVPGELRRVAQHAAPPPAAQPSKGPASKVEPTGFMPGVPLDPDAELLLLSTLVKDKCVLAAEEYLDTVGAPDGGDAARGKRSNLTPAQDLYLAYINMHRVAPRP